MVAEFDLARIKHSSATFDAQKLEWMNGEHIRRLPVAELAGEALPFAKARYGERLDIRVFEKAVALAQERATTLVQIADQAAFLFVPDDELEIEPEALEAIAKLDRVDLVLDLAIAHIETCEWTHDGINMVALLKDAGAQAREAHEGALRGDRGPHCRAPAVRIDRAARPRVGTHPSGAGHASGCRADEARVQDRAGASRSALFTHRVPLPRR